jgi:hypothetical protein
LRSSPKSDGGLNPSYEAVKATIKQFVIHHDGCSTSDMCFSVLHNERGLSVHFLVDNDGTIYQTMNLGLMAYHAEAWNVYSVGVELCNRGDAQSQPAYYKSGRFGPQRKAVPCQVNGRAIRAYEFTQPQQDSLFELCRELRRLLPNLPPEYPQSTPGVQLWDTFRDAPQKRETYAGFVGHYHLTSNKWDPGPFDFKKLCTRLRGATSFPVVPRPELDLTGNPPTVPVDRGELASASHEMYALNEQRADGGFFPVGPWGETALWHGGIHIVGTPDAGVYAPFAGRLIAARMGKDSSIGSVNFALLRHDMIVGTEPKPIRLYSLYMHLVNELKRASPSVAWMTGKTLKQGKVMLLDEPIEAGALIGHIGTVGPGALSRSQVHVEFFSEQFLNEPPWQRIDGTAGERFCEVRQILDLIDSNHDGVLARSEHVQLAHDSSERVHHMMTLHVSEWTFEPDWRVALQVPGGSATLSPAEIDAMVADQIAPGLWWDATVARHCQLPQDGVVYHYHPIAFIAWLQKQLIEAGATTRTIDDKDIRAVPANITDDRGGGSMRSSSDANEDSHDRCLTQDDLAQGYDGPECDD